MSVEVEFKQEEVTTKPKSRNESKRSKKFEGLNKAKQKIVKDAFSKMNTDRMSNNDLNSVLRTPEDRLNSAFDKYKANPGYEYGKNTNLDEIELYARKFLNFRFNDELDWQWAATNQHWFVVLFSLINKVSIKVEYVNRIINDKSIPLAAIYSKHPRESKTIRGYENIFKYITKGIDQVDIIMVDRTINDITDYDVKDKYIIFMPSFKINYSKISTVLLDKVKIEMNQYYRIDPKYILFSQYLAFDNYKELKSTKYLKTLFTNIGFEPFILKRNGAIDHSAGKGKDKKPQMLNSCSAVWMSSMLNLIQLESSFLHILKKFDVHSIIDEYITLLFSDNPNISLNFVGSLFNGLVTTLMCKSKSQAIPTYDLVADQMAIGRSYIDNLRPYDNDIADLKLKATDAGMPTFSKFIDITSVAISKDELLLVSFFGALPSISSYAGGDIFESVYRQIYSASDTLNERYEFSADEARAQAIKDWSNEALGEEELAFKDEYFERGFDKRGYTPKNFTYEPESYNLFKEGIQKGMGIIDSFTDQTKFYTDVQLRKKIYSFQTTRGASEHLTVKVQKDLDPYEIRKKESLQVYKNSNFIDTSSYRISNKRGVSIFLGTDYLLNDDIAIIPSVVSGGFRWVPGPKPPRQIFNDGISQYSLHNAVREIFNMLKKSTNFGKTKGLAISDNYFLIAASSNPYLLSIFNDFKVFDGSCKSGIQEPMYAYFLEAFKFLYSETKQMTFGQLLKKLQDPKYRQPLLIKVKNRLEIHFIDMIFSGELLTNLKDSIINFALTYIAMVKLHEKLKKFIKYDEKDIRVNGDDSHALIELLRGINLIKEGDYLNLTYRTEMIKGFEEWNESLNDIFNSLGFAFKSDYSSRYCEYLKVRVCNGIILPNLRLQFYTSEKASVLRRRFLIATIKSISGTGVERGMDSFNCWKQLIVISCSGEKITTNQMMQQNVVSLFSTHSDGGYGIPLNHQLIVLPNTTLYSSYKMLRSNQQGISNNFITRLISECYTEEAEMKLARSVASKLIHGEGFITSSTFEKPFLHQKDYNLTRNIGKSHRSREAYNKLKSLGIKVSRSVAYFNGFETYIATSLTNNVADAKFFNANELIHFKVLDNMKVYSTPRSLNQTEKVLKGFEITNLDSYSLVIDYSSRIDNVGILSSITISYLKEIFGYAARGSHSNFENDMMSEVKRLDPSAPDDLNNEALVNTLLRPEFIYDKENFELCLEVLGISRNVSTYMYDSLSENTFLYYNSVRKENFSSVSQMLTLYNIQAENVKNVIQMPDLLIGSSAVDQTIISICISSIIANSVIDVNNNLVQVRDLTGKSDMVYLAEVTRGLV